MFLRANNWQIGCRKDKQWQRPHSEACLLSGVGITVRYFFGREVYGEIPRVQKGAMTAVSAMEDGADPKSLLVSIVQSPNNFFPVPFLHFSLPG